MKKTLIISPFAMALMISSSVLHADDDYSLSPIEEVGQAIFHDTNLSQNGNQACVSCHDPKAGWSAGDSVFNIDGTVHQGSLLEDSSFGNRKPPSSAYATFSPRFYADYGNRLVGEGNNNQPDDQPRFIGGNFWDGRATGWKLGNSAADQAQGPFLNPVEHALRNPACAVQTVCDSDYRDLFDTVWSPKICMQFEMKTAKIDNICDAEGMKDFPKDVRKMVSQAYDRIALSIAAFEGSKASNAFTSKLDAVRASMAEAIAYAVENGGQPVPELTWSEEEKIGHDLFEIHCVSCHAGARGPGDTLPLLTDFSYSNLGIPKNPDILSAADRGLAGFLETVPAFVDAGYVTANVGKMKVPTLRNVALGSCEFAKNKGQQKKCIPKAYMHNGYFKSLKSVVHFYNTRDTKTKCEDLEPRIIDATEEIALENNCWPKPEVAVNIEANIMGGSEVLLDEAQEDAIVAFMRTMSDGYSD